MQLEIVIIITIIILLIQIEIQSIARINSVIILDFKPNENK